MAFLFCFIVLMTLKIAHLVCEKPFEAIRKISELSHLHQGLLHRINLVESCVRFQNCHMIYIWGDGVLINDPLGII